MSARLLRERTGESVEVWNGRIRHARLRTEQELRAWLSSRGVTGYPQSLLVMERFGYPAFLLASAVELIDAQYAERPHLRPILDALVDAAAGLGPVIVQARKTYVSLVSPRRTFARVQRTTLNRVDLALRLSGQAPSARLRPSRIHETMRFRVGLATVEEVDLEVLGWMERAYDQNS